MGRGGWLVLGWRLLSFFFFLKIPFERAYLLLVCRNVSSAPDPE